MAVHIFAEREGFARFGLQRGNTLLLHSGEQFFVGFAGVDGAGHTYFAHLEVFENVLHAADMIRMRMCRHEHIDAADAVLREHAGDFLLCGGFACIDEHSFTIRRENKGAVALVDIQIDDAQSALSAEAENSGSAGETPAGTSSFGCAKKYTAPATRMSSNVMAVNRGDLRFS